MPRAARVYITGIILTGLGILAAALWRFESRDPVHYLCYLLIAAPAAAFKVSLPTITGTMSVSFVFILIGVAQLSLPETLGLGCLASLIQCLWKPRKRPTAGQVSFNTASIAIAIAVSYLLFHSPWLQGLRNSLPVLLLLAASSYFVVNTFSVAAVIALTEGKQVGKVWRECYFWSFPYYLVGAAIAGLLAVAERYVGWQTSLLVLPVIYVIYRSYSLYLGRLEAEKKHVEEMAALHLRTIEALALAIDAKDYTTHDHLRRVQIYALEIATDLGFSETDLKALRTASLLHDIGKLAVPEHIISKPGRLTPEEFEKMKIHPGVGAEILEQVQFPYAVTPIVRSHHERWDGTGYPDGLRGEAIPIGARVLTVVDCLDALASNRQYRRALPMDQVIQKIASEAGKSFDPKVVEVLLRRHVELEQLAQAQVRQTANPLADLKIRKGVAPAAGFENSEPKLRPHLEGTRVDFLSSIGAARAEVQMLFELASDLGNSLSLCETLSVLAVRLRRLMPYDSIAIYLRRHDTLVPEFVNGENFRLFSALEIPLGQGLSGWVAENRQPIVNGNPSVEPGYLNDPSKFSTLRSALAVPLEGVSGVVGVLALYHAEKDAFTKDHLRILLAVSSKLALSIENALKYRQAESSATTDALTGLPNARSLFLHLDSELARSKRAKVSLAVLVCDLDGFKQLNDRLGHLVGNKVLQQVAAALKRACREYDYAARMGGDEFVVVLPGLAADGVEAAIRRFSSAAVEAGFQVCGESVVGMSMGPALYPEDGENAEQLLAEADRRMYKCKLRSRLPDSSGLPDLAYSLEHTVQ